MSEVVVVVVVVVDVLTIVLQLRAVLSRINSASVALLIWEREV